MIGLVLVTHGRLAEEFLDAMQHVVGEQKGVASVCIGPEDDMEERTKGSQFGHKVHWSVSNNELEQLFALDDELKVRCRSCAGHLTATVRVCPNCEARSWIGTSGGSGFDSTPIGRSCRCWARPGS